MHMKGEPMVGKEKWAKEKELCLSDAYIVKDNESKKKGGGIVQKIELEQMNREKMQSQSGSEDQPACQEIS